MSRSCLKLSLPHAHVQACCIWCASLLQVRILNLDLEQARATSTVQLIGRKKIRASEYPQAKVSSAAQRILQYLLELPSAELRQEALPEAFIRPSEGSQYRDDASSDREDAETEQLSTTPLQLLQV